ncbi:MAG TPA: tryptophan 2,3-dioxygenase family protein [Gaiellales bacterium]|nr:tryptophan 2,3-dioxygenase family protein [Gaiellales bacterium]
MEHPALTYTSYLHLDELLECQVPLSVGPEHDELLFIVIHQVYELWFKVLLHEADQLQRSLESGDTATALAAMKRILTILKTVVAQVDVLETMTPLAFGSFRGRLESASGFQSAQFRELEAVLGRRDQGVLADHPPGPARDRILAATERPSLYESFLAYAGLTGAPSQAVQDGLVEIYRTDASRAQVCERMVDIDEGIQEWRYRHVKMVERTIGDQPGTGGSAGVAYLRSTLFRPAFPDLWAIRARL